MAALGSGDLKFSSILNSLATELEKPVIETSEITVAKPDKDNYTSDINIQGIDNLLIHTANCCKSIPGEAIIGCITHNRGIAIHRADCPDAMYNIKLHAGRVIAASWSKKTELKF
ncbi:MAG: hypothetical protein LBL17_03440 [Coxiellaceae bacterium]|nr:hypothetical protein [Coxiellaceae bacterium]